MNLALGNPITRDLRSGLLGVWDVPARETTRLERQASFASVLSRARAQNEGDRADEARRAAEDFVAQALVRPVLRQMREASHAAAPFAPNRTEKAFRGMMDDALAQRIVRARGWSLVDKVRERLGADQDVRTMIETSNASMSSPELRSGTGMIPGGGAR